MSTDQPTGREYNLAENHLDFAEAITRYLDRGLTSEELVQFNAQLLADAEARKLFVRFARLHGMLQERALSGEPALFENGQIDCRTRCAELMSPNGTVTGEELFTNAGARVQKD
jgi:hypothetical protein